MDNITNHKNTLIFIINYFTISDQITVYPLNDKQIIHYFVRNHLYINKTVKSVKLSFYLRKKLYSHLPIEKV